MSGKYVKTRKIIIPTITLVIIASQLMGCSAVNSKEDMINVLKLGEAVEIEVAEPDNLAILQAGTLDWTELGKLTTVSKLRNAWDDTLNITSGKNGILYVNADGEQDNNTTLRIALHNRAFTSILSDKTKLVELAQGVSGQYADSELEDLENDELVALGINGYFNLLTDSDENYANVGTGLTRLEFMAMVNRAETPVNDEQVASQSFINSVGDSQYNDYAESLNSDSYINTSDKSLNESTANGKITRGEAIYMLMNHYFKDELQSIDLTSKSLPTFTDAKVETSAFKKAIEGIEGTEYINSSKVNLSIYDPDTYGVPEDIYKALVLAYQKGIINTATKYDEAITKVDAIQLLIDTLELDTSMDKFNYKLGTTTTTSETTETVSETNETEISSELASEIAQLESESTDPFAGQNVIVDGDFTFAADADQSDIDQILKAHDEVSVSVSECDTNGDGLIDKDEAAEAASFYDDEMIGLIKDLGEALKNTDFSDIGSDSNSDSSSSSSNSTQGAGKVETWTADPGTTPQIDFDAPVDTSDLDRGVTVY